MLCTRIYLPALDRKVTAIDGKGLHFWVKDRLRDLEGILGMSLTSSTNEIWTLMEGDTAYTLKAGRYGHGVGMSQYGAKVLADEGKTYSEILSWYYKDISFGKISK